MNSLRVILGVSPVVRSIALRRSPHLATSSRTICRASILQKAKGTKDGENEDAFAIEADGELFATPNESSQNNVNTSAAQAARLAANRTKHFQHNKSKLFDHPAYAAHHRWREQNSGKSSDSPIASETVNVRHVKATHAPRRAILALLSASASTRVELLEIVDVFTIYRAKGWPIDELNRIDFIGRCINLKSPDIALAVLYHRPSFGIDIPSISSARALLHSLLITPTPPPTPLPAEMALPTSTSFAHALLLANLFDVYALPPVEKDEVARALLLGACPQVAEGEEAEDFTTVMEKIRKWAENPQPAKSEGVIVNETGPGVKDGKIVKTSQALKMTGKAHMGKRPAQKSPMIVLPEDIPLYSTELTKPERAWIERGLDRFTQWAQAKGEDVAWVEKLKVETA
ncbi:hypothetical protein BDV93DRAFT_611145 [Ceratobasidium sp. AG-I]|nr:hypothetical protein BDV93DRAFT_611145 [Ceratobasidium sp. AG-I]